jgi:hypothetical protein
MPRTDILQSSPPISIPCAFSVAALADAPAAAVIVELAIDIVMLDMLGIVEEAVAMGIDIPPIDSIVDARR